LQRSVHRPILQPPDGCSYRRFGQFRTDRTTGNHRDRSGRGLHRPIGLVSAAHFSGRRGRDSLTSNLYSSRLVTKLSAVTAPDCHLLANVLGGTVADSTLQLPARDLPSHGGRRFARPHLAGGHPVPAHRVHDRPSISTFCPRSNVGTLRGDSTS